MVSVTTHYAYQLAVNTIAPLIASSVSSLYTSYNKEEPAPTLVRAEIDDEQDLSSLQMDRLLKWMSLIFDDSITTVKTESTELKSAYKRELYSLYTTIISDYRQYQQMKKYNNSLWILSYYRSKDTKSLAKRIIGDIKLFNEGLKMFSMFEKL